MVIRSQAYSLEVVSHHPKFKNQNLVPYFVDGIDTIGVWGDEPFELVLTNHTSEKIQGRLSVDGIDVISAKPAVIDPVGDMWQIAPYGKLSLQAWPETSEKGARFVFGAAGNSVALHTTGDLSMKGIIAAAIYREGFVAPTPIARTQNRTGLLRNRHDSYFGSGEVKTNGRLYNSVMDGGPAGAAGPVGATMDYMNLERERAIEPAVGAGETIKQAIRKVEGFRQPRLERTISMKYVWYDDLVKMVETASYRTSAQHPTGFHGAEKMADLRGTPRIERARFAQ